jgi:hypothetical protein
MKLYVGLIALAGTLFLLMVWSVQHSREAAFERLETYKSPSTSGSAR